MDINHYSKGMSKMLLIWTTSYVVLNVKKSHPGNDDKPGMVAADAATEA